MTLEAKLFRGYNWENATLGRTASRTNTGSSSSSGVTINTNVTPIDFNDRGVARTTTTTTDRSRNPGTTPVARDEPRSSATVSTGTPQRSGRGSVVAGTTGRQEEIANKTNEKLAEIAEKGSISKEDQQYLEQLRNSAQEAGIEDSIDSAITNSHVELLNPSPEFPLDVLAAGFGDAQKYFKQNPELMYLLGGGIVITTLIRLMKSKKKGKKGKK